MSRFKSPVGSIGSYEAKDLSTLQGVYERTDADVPEEQEDDPTHILLISRKKQRNLTVDCIVKQLLIKHIVKQIERESIENIFK
jgi:hypothetical protein